MNENVLDTLLQNANQGERVGDERGLEIIERLTTSTGDSVVSKSKKVEISRGKKGVKIKRTFHLVKKAKGKENKR